MNSRSYRPVMVNNRDVNPSQQLVSAYPDIACLLQNEAISAAFARYEAMAVHWKRVYVFCGRWSLVAVLLAMVEGEFRFPFGRGLVPAGRDSLDFIGLNYYSRDMATFDFRRRESYFGSFFAHPSRPQTSAGWEIYPEGVYRLLKFLARFDKPILITENGVADATDARRGPFLIRHLAEVLRAIGDGVDVRGYFHWSLLDNFEWAEGYAPRFGLVAVDDSTQTRRIRPSGRLYAQIARERALPRAEPGSLEGR